MRFLTVFILIIIPLPMAACMDRNIAVSGISLCEKWPTNPSDLALADRLQKIYVSDLDATRILVISLKSMRVEKVINTKYPNLKIVASPDEEKVYVLSTDKNKNYIFTIDTKTDEIIESIPLAVGFPDSIMLNKEGSAIFVSWKDEVTIINLIDKSQRVLQGEAIAPLGSFVQHKPHVPYQYLDAYNINTGKPALQVSEGSSVTYFATSPDQSVFVAGYDGVVGQSSSRLIFMDGKNFSTLAMIPVGKYPSHPVFSHDGKKLYIEGRPPLWQSDQNNAAEESASHLTIINVPTFTVEAVVLAKGTIGAAFEISDDNKRAYFIEAQKIDGTKGFPLKMVVSILDTEKGRIIGEVPIPPPDEIKRIACDQ